MEKAMSIGAIAGSSKFDVSSMASGIASNLMKKLDANSDGTVDKKEFVAGLTAQGFSADAAGRQFDSIDKAGKGKITQADIASAIKSAASSGSPPAGMPPAGSPPAGTQLSGGRAPAASGGSGGSASGSSSKIYDKKDGNKDGKVSAMEEITYDAAHPKILPAGKFNPTSQKNIGNNVDVAA
jgi:hypothetical protein